MGNLEGGQSQLVGAGLEHPGCGHEAEGLSPEGSIADPAETTGGVEEAAGEPGDLGPAHTHPRSWHACATRLIAIT